MKLLRLFEGGHPISNNDADWQGGGLQEAIALFVKSLIAPNTAAILKGCILDSGVLSEGVVFFQDEIFIFEETATGASESDIWFTIEETSPQSVIYADSTERNVHIDRKLVLSIGTGDTKYDTLVRLDAALANVLSSVLDAAYLDPFRNGYDPELRLNPDTGRAEWFYSAASHPDAPGTAGNPYRDLGLLALVTGFGPAGLFSVRNTTDFTLPNFANFTKLVEMPTILEDESGSWLASQNYLVPAGGTYNFLIQNARLRLVSTAVPPLVGGVQVQPFKVFLCLFKNGELLLASGVGTDKFSWTLGNTNSLANPVLIDAVNTRRTATALSGAGSRSELELRVNNPSEVGSGRFPIVDSVGTVYPFAPIHLQEECDAGDVISVRIVCSPLRNDGVSGEPHSYAANAAIAYRLENIELSQV